MSITTSRHVARAVAVALAATLPCVSLATSADAAPAPSRAATAGPRVHGGLVDLPVRGGTATVDTATLRVTARTAGGGTAELSAPAAGALGAPGRVTATADGARWDYPRTGLAVTARADHGRLLVSVKAGGTADTTLNWPVTGGDRAASSLQLARGEGLSLPVADPFWNSPRAGLVDGETAVDSGLSLPLWGYGLGPGRGVGYLVPTDIGTTLRVTSEGGRLRTAAAHRFSRGAATTEYTVAFALTDGSPVAPAREYRAWLAEHGQLGSLRRKAQALPATKKLLGAFHAYTWGQARTADGVRALRALGVDRMWLGYDADDTPMDAKAVAAAKEAGYLVGPYDSFANGQDPKTSDAPTSVWPGTVYPDFCVRGADGKPEPGFHDRGCYLSSEAFEKAEPGKHYLADRTRAMTKNGADSYFLDVDAAGELFRDHSPAHPMTKARDRANRLARMGRIAGHDRLVLGSESAGAWANGVLAFDHGSGTPVADGLWKAERDKEKWGGYTPAKAPGIFFKPAELPADVAKAMYDPAYRVPLYETALHDSLVNTERWEIPYDKLPKQKTTRALLAMLYNTPLNFVLDGPSIKERGAELAALQKYFSPLHKAAGTEALTDFRTLTGDRTVQRTVFGDGVLTVTANFGTAAYQGLPGGCVDAKLKGDAKPRRLCPADVNR
ncbi:MULTISPECIES: glycoside hydrolase [Streptomyces]|uniref:glycoside hydrolase n=1 Tax=Streptomyces TaxID=1883 RepID=UPI001C8EDD68|nr:MULTISPECIES: glycoside hydrolase [Streptomyces]UBI40132.1 glycoside hydrolase [Streptomyces mobaraensis]UKW32711.1 glycoside hydrolase [Streptomyces sp. TYQ1024]